MSTRKKPLLLLAGAVAPDGAAGLIDYVDGNYSYWTDFLFQGMFAATVATIVSGAVAERIKLGAFLTFSAIYIAFVYPFVGSWIWGGGWLAEMNFHDFAGSTLVHSVGGWAALATILLLGRTGRNHRRCGRGVRWCSDHHRARMSKRQKSSDVRPSDLPILD